MTTDAIFDSLRGPLDVELAVLSTLQTWLPTMLRVLERRHGLRSGTLRHPAGGDSYIGGIDHDSWVQDLCPMVIVVAKPTGEAERAAHGYGQWFEVEVSTTHIENTEDQARVMAGHVGTAVMGAIIQNGSLGGLASRTELTSAPTVEFIDADQRRLTRSLTTFHVFIDGIVREDAGTSTPTPQVSPQYPGTPDAPFGDWPVVVTPSVTLVANGIPESFQPGFSYPFLPGIGAFLASVASVDVLPVSGNNDGDVRLVRDIDAPYVWSAEDSGWSPLSAQSDSVLVQQEDPGNDVPVNTLWVEIDEASPPNIVAIHVAVPG